MLFTLRILSDVVDNLLVINLKRLENDLKPFYCDIHVSHSDRLGFLQQFLIQFYLPLCSF